MINRLNDAGSANLAEPERVGQRQVVLVVGETIISSEGMAAILGRDPRFEVCGAVCDQTVAEEMIQSHDPDLLLLEPFVEGAKGIEWIECLTARFPRTRILVISRPSERLHAQRALRAGASAWFKKEGSISELFHALEAALSVKLDAGSHPDLNILSDRELHVFSLIAAGHGIGRIADELGISRKTVETHCEHIKLKLNFRDAEALRRGAQGLLGGLPNEAS